MRVNMNAPQTLPPPDQGNVASLPPGQEWGKNPPERDWDDWKDRPRGREYAPTTGKSGFGGSFGSEMIDEKLWSVLILTPRLQLGRLAIGFYLPAYFDTTDPLKMDKWYNKDEYNFGGFKDFLHDFLLKIQFIQWAQKGDPVYIKLGSIDDFVIGHGFIMNNFKNTLSFPETRRIGFQFDIDSNAWGLESMMADVYEAAIFGGRLYFKPFGGFFNDFAVGFSYVTDINTDPKNKLNHATVFGAGVDAELPLPSLGIFTWKLFSDYAVQGYKTTGRVGGATDAEFGLNGGKGFTAGIKGRIVFFDYQLAYRRLQDGFIPEYFDSFYYVDDVRTGRARDLVNGSNGDYDGWVFGAGFAVDGVFQFRITCEERYGQPTNNKLELYAALERGFIPKVHANFLYERLDIVWKRFFKDIFSEKTVTTARVFYEMGKGVDLVATYRRFYKSDGTYASSYGIETQFGF